MCVFKRGEFRLPLIMNIMNKTTEVHNDANGRVVDINTRKSVKPIKAMELHFHPDVVIKNIEMIVENNEKEKVDKDIKFLFEDVLDILKWAKRRMNVKPMEEKKDE